MEPLEIGAPRGMCLKCLGRAQQVKHVEQEIHCIKRAARLSNGTFQVKICGLLALSSLSVCWRHISLCVC